MPARRRQGSPGWQDERGGRPGRPLHPPPHGDPSPALRLLGLVQVVLSDRLLLALLGHNDPGDQVHQRAQPDAEDREHREHKADDVGVDAEVLADSGADPGDHAALTEPVQLLAITHSVHTSDHALPGEHTDSRTPSAYAEEWSAHTGNDREDPPMP